VGGRTGSDCSKDASGGGKSMSLALDILDKGITDYAAAEVTKETATLQSKVTTQATEITALKSTVTARNATITTLETEVAALKAENERLRNGTPVPPDDDDETPPDDDDETPTIPVESIFIDRDELMNVPITASNAPWQRALAQANAPKWGTGSANLGDNNSLHDVGTFVGAIVAVRLNDPVMRQRVVDGLLSAMRSPLTRTLELGRGLQAYVMAADLIGFRLPEFCAWVVQMCEHVFDKDDTNMGLQTLLLSASSQANNWSHHARHSVLCAGLYLRKHGDAAQKAKGAAWVHLAVESHKRVLELPHDASVVPPLKYRDYIWRAKNSIGGVNPKGSSIVVNGEELFGEGILHQDWGRIEGEPVYPFNFTEYGHEANQGLVACAITMHRHGLLDVSKTPLLRSVGNVVYHKGEWAEKHPDVKLPLPDKDDMFLAHGFKYLYPDESWPLGDDVTAGKGYGFVELASQGWKPASAFGQETS
jgi:hypothetical protein